MVEATLGDTRFFRRSGPYSLADVASTARVKKNYNIMGVAKAALESAVRYVSAELGPKGIRVHAISPGPLATRAASGIPEFDKLLEEAKAKAPARSLVSIEDVGAATAFLAHDVARLITGTPSTSMGDITWSIDLTIRLISCRSLWHRSGRRLCGLCGD